MKYKYSDGEVLEVEVMYEAGIGATVKEKGKEHYIVCINAPGSPKMTNYNWTPEVARISDWVIAYIGSCVEQNETIEQDAMDSIFKTMHGISEQDYRSNNPGDTYCAFAS